MLPVLSGHGVLVVLADKLRSGDKKTGCAAGGVTDKVLWRGLQQFHHHLTDVLGCAELSVLTCRSQLAQHILVKGALHIQIGNVVFIQIIQPGDNLLQHLRSGDQEHGVAHIPGKSGVALVCAVGCVGSLLQLALVIEIGQTAVFHQLHCGENPLTHDGEDFSGVLVLESAPAHRLTNFRIRKNLGQMLAGHVFKFFCLKFFLVQRADEHEIGSMTVSGFVMPPAQMSVQILSILFLITPVIILMPPIWCASHYSEVIIT